MAGKNSVFVDNSPPSADATWLNLTQQEQNNLITGTGQSLSDAIDNQQAISASRFAANNFYIDSGAANAYVLTLAASMTNPVSSTVGYYVGMTIRFRAGNANTGASTVNVNGAGVKNLKKEDGATDLVAGDIPTTQDSIFRYDGTSFVLQTGSASTTAKGIIEIATNAEVTAGTDTQRAIVPSALANLYGASSISTDSYTRKPVKVSGAFAEEITQYGNFTTTITAGGSQTITFPLTFPTAVRSIVITINGTGGPNDALSAPIITARSTSSFTVKNTDVDSTITSLYWQARGN